MTKQSTISTLSDLELDAIGGGGGDHGRGHGHGYGYGRGDRNDVNVDISGDNNKTAVLTDVQVSKGGTININF
jgi:hypothetical protein